MGEETPSHIKVVLVSYYSDLPIGYCTSQKGEFSQVIGAVGCGLLLPNLLIGFLDRAGTANALEGKFCNLRPLR
jgi:hypothetical protein